VDHSRIRKLGRGPTEKEVAETMHTRKLRKV
jgi:hypothetical protein